MKRISVLLVFAATAAWAQESYLAASDPSWKGLEIRFVTKIEPPGANAESRLPGGVVTEAGRAHHLINDAANKSYFGYDVLLEPNADGTTGQIRIEPLHPMPGGISGPSGWRLLQLPSYPVIPNVRVGDTVALDLLVNTATGQKIVDYLTLRRRGGPNGREARDFSLADVNMSLSQPKLWIDGKPAASHQFPGGTAGSRVWFYLEGHGRFILSLFPNEKYGLKKNGTVTGNTLTFHDGSREYRVESSEAIAPGLATYNLYVAHESDWPGLGEAFSIGSESADSHLVIQKN